MDLTHAELIVESDEDLEIFSSLCAGFDDRGNLVIELDFDDLTSRHRKHLTYAILDGDETKILADSLHIPPQDIPARLRERFQCQWPIPVPSEVGDTFRDILNFIIDCGAKYRLREE